MADERVFTEEEKKIFSELKVADDETGLKNLIQGQRRVNGLLCQALFATIEALENQVTGADPSGRGRSVTEAIEHAKKVTTDVAGPPPGCE
jgi:hypothetical protein